jgi:hypothetical protein
VSGPADGAPADSAADASGDDGRDVAPPPPVRTSAESDVPVRLGAEPAPPPDLEVVVTAVNEIVSASVEVPGQRRASRAGSAGSRAPVRRSRARATVVACPYCAEPLDSPPVASGKCPRCRQRIVVRQVGDRAVYLTEAALPVFMAERRRAAHAGRWARERDRWLEHAIAAGADPAAVTRLTRQPVSEDVIEASRSLYLSTVARAVRTARLERRWEDASRLRGDQALVLYRIARSATPVPAHVLEVYRDGVASDLRGIAEVAKFAELRAASCCEACKADDGRTVRITDELRTPSLPHLACAKGLCRCRWYLADRDREIVTGLLKRQTRIRPPRKGRTSPGA